MNNRILLCTILGAALLTGASAALSQPVRPGGGSPPWADCPDPITPPVSDFCTNHLCSLAVQIGWSVAQNSCVVNVPTSPLKMKGNHPTLTPDWPGVAIVWWLPDSSNWEFRAEPPNPAPPFSAPIIFKGANAAGAPSQFSYSVVYMNGTRAAIYDKNTDTAQYDYKIRVYRKGKPNYLESDPAIFNDAN